MKALATAKKIIEEKARLLDGLMQLDASREVRAKVFDASVEEQYASLGVEISALAPGSECEVDYGAPTIVATTVLALAAARGTVAAVT